MEKQDSANIYPVSKQPEYRWSNRVVLITEDEEVNFIYLETALSKTNVKVIRAKNGEEAVGRG